MPHSRPARAQLRDAPADRCSSPASRASPGRSFLTKAGSIASPYILDHRELAARTLRNLFRTAGVRVEEFRTALG